MNNNDLMKKLRAAFKAEAEDRLNILNVGLVELEKTTASEKHDEIIESVFRQTHSLKGASRSVGLPDIEKISRAMEDAFFALKRKKIRIYPEMMDVLYEATDMLSSLAGTLGSQCQDIHENRISEIVERIKALISGKRVGKTKFIEKKIVSVQDVVSIVETQEKQKDLALSKQTGGKSPKERGTQRTISPQAQTIRVSMNKLDLLMRQAEEMLQIKLLAKRHQNELEDVIEAMTLWKKDGAQIVDVANDLTQIVQKGKESDHQEKTALVSVSELMELVKSHQNRFRLFEDRLLGFARAAHLDQTLIRELVDRLLEDMKDVMMLPFSFFLEMIPRIVRDLARDQNKTIKVSIAGGKIEIDRKILEEMKDPLIHLLRNCVDHGIEKSKVREKNKKSGSGTVKVIISQANGDKIQIAISDDGAGIDLEKVKKAAVKKGVISGHDVSTISREEALDLIFQSGITTSSIITDISGRGLGLAIVREKVERLGGKVSIESSPGKGTLFRVILPITLATFRGILVKVGGQQFVIPTVNVDRVIKFKAEDVKTIENRETIPLNGQTIPLVRLDDILEIQHKESSSALERILAMVLGKGKKRIAFRLDQVLDEGEILFKSLGKQLARVRNIYGATVLGNRKVVPILNVMDLMKSAVHVKPMASGPTTYMEKNKAEKISVLVAEDSITSRMLLKTILESAGYQVKTVVDGLEALTELKQGEYNLLVSDVDMPRMNGFVLTQKIRDHKKLGDLPVILVTALHSREDRERGIDVGANAYIIKSSFDQRNLLEVVKKYI
jgi:two-component system chemotaxis sensor kinase CheA